MTDTNQYAERDPMELDRDGNYYCRHVSAMTAEGLHKKSDIAAELAWRDREIDRLTALSARASAGEGGEPDAKLIDWLRRINDAGSRLAKHLGEGQPHSDMVCTVTGLSALALERLTAAPQPAQAGASGGELVLVPRRLTAENGAKGLLSGEFCEHFEFKCAECDDDGMVDGETPCDDCDGRGSHRVKVPVEWTTIKAIHRMVVEHLAAAPQPQEARAQERDDSGPYEFGAGIPDNPKAKYWQDRAYFWRSHAIALGYVAGDGTQHCHPAHGDGEGDDVTETIIRDVCELDPSDPEHHDTVCIKRHHLRQIIKRTLALPAQGEGK